MQYDKYTDQLSAQNESIHIDYVWEVLFGYSYMKLRLTERSDAPSTDKTLVYAGKAFKILNGWTAQRFGSTKDNMYKLGEFFSWIRDEAIVLRLKDRVPEYEWPERAAQFMGQVLNAQKYPKGLTALKFVRRADFWEIGFENLKHFKHQKGMAYIQFLLTHPSKSYSCHDLLRIQPTYDALCTKFFEKNPEYAAPAPEEPDENAIIMKQDLAEMQRELEEAEDNSSLDVDTIRDELNERAQRFNSLYDHKCRPRNTGSQDDKARGAVSKAIKASITKISKALPELKPVLSGISLGMHIEYSPGLHPVEVFVAPA
jgi:hypothetical protein